MKKLLIQFLVSRSLDTGRPLRGLWRRWISRSADLARFEQAARELHHRLKEPVPGTEHAPPSTLHASIMRAVRESWSESGVEVGDTAWGFTPALRWGTAAAGLVLLAVSLWLGRNHWSPPGGRTVQGGNLTALPAVGPLAEQVTTNGIAVLTLPLNRQIEGLARDLQETAQFLLASLP